MHRVLFLAGLVCLTSGCGAVVPATALRLAALNPLDADPAGMMVQVALPDGAGIAEGSARLRLAAQNGLTGQRQEGDYRLQPLPGGLWRVHPADQARLRADQARVATWEAADPDATRGQFSATLGPCATGGGPAPDARLSVGLQLEPGAPFLPLIRDARLTELFGEDTLGQLPSCAAPPLR